MYLHWRKINCEKHLHACERSKHFRWFINNTFKVINWSFVFCLILVLLSSPFLLHTPMICSQFYHLQLNHLITTQIDSDVSVLCSADVIQLLVPCWCQWCLSVLRSSTVVAFGSSVALLSFYLQTYFDYHQVLQKGVCWFLQLYNTFLFIFFSCLLNITSYY